MISKNRINKITLKIINKIDKANKIQYPQTTLHQDTLQATPPGIHPVIPDLDLDPPHPRLHHP